MELSYCKYCKLPKHQCQCTSGDWSADYKTINLPCQDCLLGSGLCKKHKALTPLGEELQKPCPRCNQPWIRHDCPSEHSGSIYKHIVYNPLMKNILVVIQEAQDEENLNSGLEWQFVRTQPITEYEWVAIFEKWIY